MSGFRKLLSLRPLQDGKWWVLLEPVTWENGFTAHVPLGFTTDFASTPRLLWWLLPPYGRYAAAAVVHDRDYHVGAISRAHADERFLRCLASLGVLIGVRYAMWASVRAFGARAWLANARERRVGGCSPGCASRCARVLDPIPELMAPVRPRGLERLLYLLHGRKAA